MGGESTECINERSGVGVTAKNVGRGMCEWVKCVALALFGQVMKMKDCFEVSICGWDWGKGVGGECQENGWKNFMSSGERELVGEELSALRVSVWTVKIEDASVVGGVDS